MGYGAGGLQIGGRRGHGSVFRAGFLRAGSSPFPNLAGTREVVPKRKKTTKECQSYTQNGTSAAQHKTQGKRKADMWKEDCERRSEEHKTLLDFPSPKPLNYYWLLIFYFNIVHLCGSITYKSLLGLACAHNTFTGIPVNL